MTKNNIALDMLQKTTSRQGGPSCEGGRPYGVKKQYGCGLVAKHEMLMNIYKIAKRRVVKRVTFLYKKRNKDKRRISSGHTFRQQELTFEFRYVKNIVFYIKNRLVENDVSETAQQ